MKRRTGAYARKRYLQIPYEHCATLSADRGQTELVAAFVAAAAVRGRGLLFPLELRAERERRARVQLAEVALGNQLRQLRAAGHVVHVQAVVGERAERDERRRARGEAARHWER